MYIFLDRSRKILVSMDLRRSGMFDSGQNLEAQGVAGKILFTSEWV